MAGRHAVGPGGWSMAAGASARRRRRPVPAAPARRWRCSAVGRSASTCSISRSDRRPAGLALGRRVVGVEMFAAVHAPRRGYHCTMRRAPHPPARERAGPPRRVIAARPCNARADERPHPVRLSRRDRAPEDRAESVLEIHVDATRRDARMRQFVERAREAGARLVDSERPAADATGAAHTRHQGVVARVTPLARAHPLDDVLDAVERRGRAARAGARRRDRPAQPGRLPARGRWRRCPRGGGTERSRGRASTPRWPRWPAALPKRCLT